MLKKNTIEEIKHKNKLIAIIIRKNYKNDKTTFFSSPEYSQQLGYIKYKKEGIIKAHFHKIIDRNISLTQEVLFIKKGKMIINFYTKNKKYITYRELEKGDIIFLCNGGHGLKMLKDSEIIEVKQGPYSGHDSDKICFNGKENDICK